MGNNPKGLDFFENLRVTQKIYEIPQTFWIEFEVN